MLYEGLRMIQAVSTRPEEIFSSTEKSRKSVSSFPFSEAENHSKRQGGVDDDSDGDSKNNQLVSGENLRIAGLPEEADSLETEKF